MRCEPCAGTGWAPYEYARPANRKQLVASEILEELVAIDNANEMDRDRVGFIQSNRLIKALTRARRLLDQQKDAA